MPTGVSQATHQPISVWIPLADEHGVQYSPSRSVQLTLVGVRREQIHDGVQSLTFQTDAGPFVGKFHPVERRSESQSRAVVWVGGAGGGLDGPARGLYPAACAELQQSGVAGLRIDYRRPGDLPACILDTLLVAAFLCSEGMERIALVGHSFGGAVVVSAGALSREVTAVVPLSTQAYGTDLASQVAPRPMLIVHGMDDEILPYACSERVYAAAREPKELKLYPEARHGLDAVCEDLLRLLVDWLQRNT